MKPFQFSISKNVIILTLLTLLSGVIVFTQIRYGRLETQLKTIASSFPITDHINPDDLPDTLVTMSYVRSDYDSILEANKLLKKKVDYYFEYYRESIHNRYKSAFVSHEIADTITIVDCDTWESIPRYTINCDTITGDCQLKMIR